MDVGFELSRVSDATRIHNAFSLAWALCLPCDSQDPFSAILLKVTHTHRGVTIELDEKLVKRCDKIKEEYHQPSISLCLWVGLRDVTGRGNYSSSCSCIPWGPDEQNAYQEPWSTYLWGGYPPTQNRECDSSPWCAKCFTTCLWSLLLRMPKTGSIFNGGTKKPHLAYNVTPLLGNG